MDDVCGDVRVYCAVVDENWMGYGVVTLFYTKNIINVYGMIGGENEVNGKLIMLII